MLTGIITYDPDTDTLKLQTPFALAGVCRAIPGGRWDKLARCWRYPATVHGGANLLGSLKSNGVQIAFADELSQRRLASMMGQLVKTEMVQQSDPKDLPEVPGAKMPPWGHQKLGYHMIDTQEATYLIWEMGCGKSAPVVWWLEEHRPKLGLIVCPLPVVPVWPRELEKHGHGRCMAVPLDHGDMPRRIQRAEMAMRQGKAEGAPVIIVVNYEALYRDEFVAWLAKFSWEIVIADEVHKIKSPSGVASKALATVGRKARKRVGLTGTPMHSPMDLYGQFRFLEPGVFGTSFLQFRNRYAVMGGYKMKEVVGYQNSEELNRKLFSIAHRITAKEALPFLPGFRYSPRYVELGSAARAAYASMENDMIAKVGTGEVTAANALAKLLRLQQITSGYLVTEERIDDEHIVERVEKLDDGKRKCLEEFITEEAESASDDGTIHREPVVVFCRFTHDLAEVRAAAAACGREYLELSGNAKEWEEWQYRRDGGEVIGVQIQSGGAGIDLTRSRFCVDYSVGFSLIDYLQSRKRTLRPGQKRDVTYVQLIAAGTVDERVYQSLEQAAQVAEAMLQKGADLTTGSRDIVRELVDGYRSATP